jgi:polyvinyl alcohol dehydrogenase (cytochrome)
MRRKLLAFALAVLACATLPTSGAPRSSPIGPYDWPTYGHDLHHTFHARTALDDASVRTLAPRWFFPTGDAVTANPIRVGGTIYVGSWDGSFYAIDALDGTRRWAFSIDRDQPAIAPTPGDRQPDDFATDGGYITSSALYVPAKGRRPALIIFGGGGTLYALHASNGRLFFKRKFTGRGEVPLARTNMPKRFGERDDVRIFSSPAVVEDRIYFSVDVDGNRGYRGYLVALNFDRLGTTRWIRELDVDRRGKLRNDGCGNVWTSPTIIERLDVEIVAVADCHFHAPPPYEERILAVDLDDGHLVWVTSPPRLRVPPYDDPDCDFDFGATANYGRDRRGREFLGIGGKDGAYYRLDPATGRVLWHTRVVFGGLAGGFIGTTAFDGNRVYGATALGDFGRFEGFGALGCSPAGVEDGVADLPIQEPSIHAFNLDGTIAWQGALSQSFGPTTTANGMTFVCTGITKEVQIRDADDGTVLNRLPLPASCDSGAVVTKNAVFVGTGSSEQGMPDGVWAFTPLAEPVE